MGLVKCPRCELNYILDDEKLCTICRREVRGEPDPVDAELCSECGENPALPGGEMCLFCLKELNRSAIIAGDEPIVPGAVIEIDSVSTMDEIELDTDDAEFGDEEYEESDEEEEVIDIHSLEEEELDDEDEDD